MKHQLSNNLMSLKHYCQKQPMKNEHLYYQKLSLPLTCYEDKTEIVSVIMSSASMSSNLVIEIFLQTILLYLFRY
jgi:hypothetical protein